MLSYEGIFTARCYASAVLDVGLCPCLSVCHKSVFYRNGWTNRAGFRHVSFLPPVLHCVKRKFGYLQNKGTFLWNFIQNFGLRKFLHGISIVEACYQLSSRKVDAQFCTVAWQLARFQLTRRIARSLGDTWASWGSLQWAAKNWIGL